MGCSIVEYMIELLHTHIPDPILFSFGPFDLHWYGTMIALGVLMGTYALVRLAKQYEISASTMYDFLFWALLFGVVGARVYYVMYNWAYYANHVIEIPMIWHGGLAIHGGLLAGAGVLLAFSYKRAISALLFFDLAVVGVVIGQIFGRWGNYFNQEIFGYPTSLAWGIPILPEFRPEQFVTATHFHPTFLYEILLNTLLLAILLLGHRYKAISGRLSHGILGMVYLIGYGIIRAIMEQFRVDYSPMLFSFRWAFIFSLILIIAGSIGIITILWRKKHRSLK